MKVKVKKTEGMNDFIREFIASLNVEGSTEIMKKVADYVNRGIESGVLPNNEVVKGYVVAAIYELGK